MAARPRPRRSMGGPRLSPTARICACGRAKGPHVVRCRSCYEAARQRPTPTLICRECETPFVAVKDRESVCSVRCAARRGRRGQAFRAAQRRAMAAVVRSVASACKACGAWLSMGRSWCSRTCRNVGARAYHARTRKKHYHPRQCVRCGVGFTPTRRTQAACTARCSRRHSKDAEKRQRKARRRQVPTEKVHRLKVFARDQWTCQACGVATPRTNLGLMVDDAPELDHIVPLALGGAHTYANTQCLCRRCNGAKGATPPGGSVQGSPGATRTAPGGLFPGFATIGGRCE